MTQNQKTATEVFGGPISIYTRTDALDAGLLVDVSKAAAEAGFRWPFALTATAWSDLVQWPDDDPGHDESGRLWDLLVVTRLGLRAAVEQAQVEGEAKIPTHLYGVPRGREHAVRTDFIIGLNLNEDGQPCITVMLPGED